MAYRKSPLLLLALSPLLAGCAKEDVPGLGFERGISSVNDHTLPLWQGAWIAAGVVGVFTLILILWPVFFHRKKDENFPKQTQYNIPVEVAYTIIPFIIVAVLFYFTVQQESKIVKLSPDAKIEHFIDINAVQWSWQFNYKDAGDYKSATVTGTPERWPTLYLPVNENVRFTLKSNDVVHAIYIPSFMYQMQALPGVTNHFEFYAKKLGTYRGYCNLFCGRDHTRMRFTVKVVIPSEYQTYLANLVAEEKAALS